MITLPTPLIPLWGILIKAREDNWFKRGVKEAIHIKQMEGDLYKDKGRHQLPSVYDSIIPFYNLSVAGQMVSH